MRDGNAVLWVWETTHDPVWSQELLPDSDALAVYRHTIRDAGGALREPIADPPQVDSDRMREVWRREDRNVELALSGEAGVVRPVQCFEAIFFALQSERFDPVGHPTEFIVATVRKGDDVKLYFGAGDTVFPPKNVYPFAAVEQDVASGWTFESALHNHTVQTHDGQPALGVPAPSTNDVMLSRSLADRLGLERVLVTNGFYTVEIEAEHLDAYEVPPPSTE